MIYVAWCALLLSGITSQSRSQGPEAYWDAWLALLHYQRHGGQWVSDVEDPSFFLDVEGRRDPLREWRAARRGFLLHAEERPSDDHAQCRFPARFTLMTKALGWSEADVPHVDCPDLEEHERRLRARSLSVVFASHYLNNPASAFGHTLLYLGSDGNRDAVLADYSVSFEADVEGMGPAQYLPRGLFGGLVAGYRLAPLYERVRKYERDEQRDLWLFPLQVTQGEIDQLVRHLWELRDITFRYGFFGGNCAQKILALVHAVIPEREVLPYSPAAVLPSEVARRLVERLGLAGEPALRPSQLSEYSRLVAALSPQEQEQLDGMVASRNVVAGASPAVLSAALLWSEIDTPHRAFRRAGDREDHDDLIWRRALWAARVVSDDVDEDESRPKGENQGPSLLESHGPSRLVLRGGHHDGRGSVLNIGVRWLLHDAVDPPAGYPPISSLEVARVDVGINAAGEVFVDEVTAVRVERLASASRYQSPLAWKMDIGARRLGYGRESPLHIGVEVGVGVGVARLRPNHSVALYSMVGARPGAALASRGVSFYPAGIWSGGLLLRLPADVRARISGEYAVSLGSFRGGGGALNAVARKGLTRDWDLEVAAILDLEGSALTLGFVSFN